MTVDALKALVMLQLGEDVEDVSDYDVLLNTYLERGYVLMMDKYMGGELSTVEPLATENVLPERFHSALADYATFRILQNGNAQKQQRGQAFYATFIEMLNKLRSKADEDELTANETDLGTKAFYFKNLYSS